MPEADIGVVIPAYNAGHFIQETIESIRAQTLNRWECRIVDDGSTDETPRYLQSFRDPRIRYVRQENRGEMEARWLGFTMTQAPKIVFLDADDRLLPDALARFSSFLDNHPLVGVAYGGRTLIDKNGHPFGRKRTAFFNKHPEGDILESILCRPFLSTPSQACLRRGAVRSAKWLKHAARCGDWVLLAGAAYSSRFAYMGPSPLVEYRIHGNSQLRHLAKDSEDTVEISEYDEVLNCLFSLPGLEARFGPDKLTELRRAATASCLAIKGQELLRSRRHRAAKLHFRAALQAGSRDIRDILCWLGTFSPFLLRWAEPLYGVVSLDKPPNTRKS